MKTKLVRDKIPELIVENNQIPEYYIASDDEYETRLFDKMTEELNEFIENPSMEEAADMYEVWLTILEHWNMVPLDVASCANKKRMDRENYCS